MYEKTLFIFEELQGIVALMAAIVFKVLLKHVFYYFYNSLFGVL